MEHFFDTREEASIAAADCIATALDRRLGALRSTSFVVTGRSSPKACYVALAKKELPWDRVHVVLSDERWVPPAHKDSNERLIRSSFIDENNYQLCIPIRTVASPHPRISLTISALLKSDEIVLLFFGNSKLEVYEQAKLEATMYPVSRLLHQERVPVSVFWAP